jgi:Flp pilus assembly protein TadD
MRDQYQSDAIPQAPRSHAPAFSGASPRPSRAPSEASATDRTAPSAESTPPQIHPASITRTSSQVKSNKLRMLIYGTGIKNLSNYHKTKDNSFSDLRCRGVSHFHSHTRPSLPPFRLCVAILHKINRKPGKIERLVSHRKQRTGAQINRKLSQGPLLPFFLFYFPCSAILSHGFLSQTTLRLEILNLIFLLNLLFSNRNSGLLEFSVSHRKQRIIQILIATRTAVHLSSFGADSAPRSRETRPQDRPVRSSSTSSTSSTSAPSSTSLILKLVAALAIAFLSPSARAWQAAEPPAAVQPLPSQETPSLRPPTATAPSPELEAARSLLQQGNINEADAATRDFLQKHADSADAHFFLGYILFREIQSHGTNESTLNYPASAPEAKFREEKAIASLAEYTSGAKHQVPSAADLNVVAFDYVLLADYPDADKWMTRSVEKNPNDSEARYALGRIKYAENRFDEAIQSFEQCLRLDPKSVKAEDNLGLSYEGLGQKDAAVAAYKQAIEWQSDASLNQGSPKDDPFINMGSLLLDEDRATDALPYLRQAAAMAPQDAKAHERLGKAYTHLNQLPQAQAELEKAVSLAPDVASLHFMLGQVYRKEGLAEKAKVELKRTEELNGTHSSDKAPAP